VNFALDNPMAGASAVTLTLAPLDVPLRVEVAQTSAIGAAAAACRGWKGNPDRLSEALHLRIELSPALESTGLAMMQVDGSCVTVRGPGVRAFAELDRGFARCAVSAAYMEAPGTLRQEVLEPLVLMLLTRRDRTPFHASGFIVDGLAILLAGRTGAGKSCLARAADAAGFQVLSDDTVFVQLEPHLKVWGWPAAAHLFAQDAPDATGPTRSRNGKVKQVVPLRSASRTAISSERTALCLLSHSSEPALSPISTATVMERLWPLDEGFDLLAGPITRAAGRLSANGAWDLRLSADPAEAIRLLVANLPRLRDAAAR
jgi:hypothetical protein